jgi:hypothetical protein
MKYNIDDKRWDRVDTILLVLIIQAIILMFKG